MRSLTYTLIQIGLFLASPRLKIPAKPKPILISFLGILFVPSLTYPVFLDGGSSSVNESNFYLAKKNSWVTEAIRIAAMRINTTMVVAFLIVVFLG